MSPKTQIKKRSETEALESFELLCSEVEEALSGIGAAFVFGDSEDEEGQVMARPVGVLGIECVIALDGFDGVTVSWMVQESEQASGAAEFDEAERIADWMAAQLEGGVEE